jgi:hypothetical protein
MQRLLLLLLILGSKLLAAEADSGRQQFSLDGNWLFQRDGTAADTWKSVTVPHISVA